MQDSKALNNESAIKVSGVSKKYSINRQKDSSLRESLGGAFRLSSSNKNEFWALSDISFELKKGDLVGVIGKNGAGKSTLLKILSQITKPTEGRIEINGRIASLLEVGTGFHPELTGRENIYLNGTILGMTRKEVKTKFDEIVTFSGVERFIDTPVKHYSSGMYMRLAFAVAAHLETEVLIIDEVLAVGDAEFQKKCLGKMHDVAKSGRTVIFVSHNMGSIKSLCNKGIVLSSGKIVFNGEVNEALHFYNAKTNHHKVFHDTSDLTSRSRGAKQIFICSIELNDTLYTPSSRLEVKINLKKNDSSFKGKIALALFVFDELQTVIYQFSSLFLKEEFLFSEEDYYSFTIDQIGLSGGTYQLGVWLGGNGFEQDYVDNGITFEVSHDSIYENKATQIVSLVQKAFVFTNNLSNFQ